MSSDALLRVMDRQLHKRLENAEFRRRFNGPPPAVVEFESEEDAALAVEFEQQRSNPRRVNRP